MLRDVGFPVMIIVWWCVISGGMLCLVLVDVCLCVISGRLGCPVVCDIWLCVGVLKDYKMDFLLCLVVIIMLHGLENVSLEVLEPSNNF